MTKLAGWPAIGAIVTAMAAVALTPATAQAGGRGAAFFKQADTNNDGALSMEEMQAARMKRFDGADADKDGFISAGELTAHHEARMKEKQDDHFKGFTTRFDGNKDGKVAIDEIKTHEPEFFKKADANSDGKLTADEMKAAKSKGHHGMGGGMQLGPDGE